MRFIQFHSFVIVSCGACAYSAVCARTPHWSSEMVVGNEEENICNWGAREHIVNNLLSCQVISSVRWRQCWRWAKSSHAQQDHSQIEAIFMVFATSNLENRFENRVLFKYCLCLWLLFSFPPASAHSLSIPRCLSFGLPFNLSIHKNEICKFKVKSRWILFIWMVRLRIIISQPI